MPGRNSAVRAFLAVFICMIPLLSAAQDATPTYIVPSPGGGEVQRGVYTTHAQPDTQPQPLPPQALPWQQPVTPPANNAAPSAYQPKLPAKLPFGFAAPNVSQPLPAGPHTTEAMPVQDVDSVETSEPAPAAPPTDVANPAAENPAVPTAETSPIFANDGKGPAPKKVVVRALNKVTGQSALLEIKPGETAAFGNLDVTAITCQQSQPGSQLDYAGLLELNEHIPGQLQPKLRFKGWMYATSPSITSLEHPIYDVTMVKCDIPQPAPPPDEKQPAKFSKKKKTK